jgi:aminoglycoside/choline kinase family phosphotransferase
MEEDKNGLRQRIRSLLQRSQLDVDVHSDMLTLLPGGSDRRFYRLQGARTRIIMVAPTENEIVEYVQVQEHLLKHGVAVPEIYAAVARERMVLMEDIGTSSLYEIVREATNPEAVEMLYENVLRSLVQLQLSANDGIEQCKPVFERVFDYDVLRWESDYFREEFLERCCGCSKSETGRLEKDFNKLARLLAAEPLYFMHRDFQSTNIFVKEKRIRIIDFQSAHRGMLSYDLAALLRDSYVAISATMENALLLRYHALLCEHTDVYQNEKDFRKVYILSAIQRNMQALGAFSFLSSAKKKAWFFKAIPRALAYLQQGLDEAGTFRAIRNMVYSKRITECVQSMSS